jgi:hypothetical protein
MTPSALIEMAEQEAALNPSDVQPSAPRLEITSSRQFSDWLAQEGLSLAFST